MARKNRLTPRKRYAASFARRWVLARKACQYLALAGFIAISLQVGRLPVNLANIPLRLDPLAMASSSIAARILVAGSSLALLTIALTLIFGRAWCGWLCPLGTVLDIFSPKPTRATQRKIPEGWRSVKYILLLVILAAAFFGNLTLLILDPLTILMRTLTVSLWPVIDQVVTAVEMAIYRFPRFAGLISIMDAWLRPGILPVEPVAYRAAWFFAVLLLGLVALNWVASRFYCRYLCPLGGLLGLLSKIALVQRQVKEDCKGCALCSRVCPTGAIDPEKGYASDPGECTMCLECLDSCPRGSVVFQLPRTFREIISLAEWNDYDPNRRQALVAMGGTIAAVSLFRSDVFRKHPHPYLLRPPGVGEEHLLSSCIRCAVCIRICPTGALQPALVEAGIEGLWTPVLMPRLGYCDYACNACGHACPVEAIPPLDLGTKREQIIGKAYIDQNRCIAWADRLDCIVCEEMCPVPDKAIRLEEAEAFGGKGKGVTVKLPYVIRDRCIGCGICEYKCPVVGEGAIRVYASQA